MYVDLIAPNLDMINEMNDVYHVKGYLFDYEMPSQQIVSDQFSIHCGLMPH
jgi:hypothetical protein